MVDGRLWPIVNINVVETCATLRELRRRLENSAPIHMPESTRSVIKELEPASSPVSLRKVNFWWADPHLNTPFRLPLTKVRSVLSAVRDLFMHTEMSTLLKDMNSDQLLNCDFQGRSKSLLKVIRELIRYHPKRNKKPWGRKKFCRWSAIPKIATKVGDNCSYFYITASR